MAQNNQSHQFQQQKQEDIPNLNKFHASANQNDKQTPLLDVKTGRDSIMTQVIGQQGKNINNIGPYPMEKHQNSIGLNQSQNTIKLQILDQQSPMVNKLRPDTVKKPELQSQNQGDCEISDRTLSQVKTEQTLIGNIHSDDNFQDVKIGQMQQHLVSSSRLKNNEYNSNSQQQIQQMNLSQQQKSENQKQNRIAGQQNQQSYYGKQYQNPQPFDYQAQVNQQQNMDYFGGNIQSQNLDYDYYDPQNPRYYLHEEQKKSHNYNNVKQQIKEQKEAMRIEKAIKKRQSKYNEELERILAQAFLKSMNPNYQHANSLHQNDLVDMEKLQDITESEVQSMMSSSYIQYNNNREDHHQNSFIKSQNKKPKSKNQGSPEVEPFQMMNDEQYAEAVIAEQRIFEKIASQKGQQNESQKSGKVQAAKPQFDSMQRIPSKIYSSDNLEVELKRKTPNTVELKFSQGNNSNHQSLTPFPDKKMDKDDDDPQHFSIESSMQNLKSDQANQSKLQLDSKDQAKLEDIKLSPKDSSNASGSTRELKRLDPGKPAQHSINSQDIQTKDTNPSSYLQQENSQDNQNLSKQPKPINKSEEKQKKKMTGCKCIIM